MSLADLKNKLVDLSAEVKILSRRCEGDNPSEADLSELQAKISEHESLKAEIAAKEQQQELIRSAQEISASAVVPNAPPAAVVPTASAPIVDAVHERVQDDPQAGFRSGQEFFNAVMTNDERNPQDDRLRPLAAIGTDEHRGNSNPDGGFLIPEGFSPNLLTTGFEGDPTAGMVTNIPMQSPLIKIPARVDKDHSSSVTGGFKFYRRNEAETVNPTKTQFEQVKLDAASLMGISFATDELIKDSPLSVAAIISQGFGEEFGSHMLGEKIRGTGVGELEGFLNSPGLVTISKESGQAANTIVGANITKMRARAWGYDRGVWMANSDIYPSIVTAHLTGTNGDIFLFTPGNGIDVPDTLLGRPIIFTDHMSTLGSHGDLAFCNWSQYLFGDYQKLEGASSMHVRFLNNESTFKVSARNDGRCWWRSALTPKKGANTKSPFVSLAARA